MVAIESDGTTISLAHPPKGRVAARASERANAAETGRECPVANGLVEKHRLPIYPIICFIVFKVTDAGFFQSELVEHPPVAPRVRVADRCAASCRKLSLFTSHIYHSSRCARGIPGATMSAPNSNYAEINTWHLCIRRGAEGFSSMTWPRFLLLAVAGAIGDGSVMGRASGVFAQGRGHHTAPITIPARWWLWIILFPAYAELTSTGGLALSGRAGRELLD